MTVVPVASLQEYFRDAVQTALGHQRLQVEDDTAHYVVSLLTSYARSEQLFDATPDGTRLKPLVVMLSEALEAADSGTRQRGLQRLGDVSLFVAGFFADGFARKLIDIDYHIAMGGRAYAVLSEALSIGRRQTLSRVFAELASKGYCNAYAGITLPNAASIALHLGAGFSSIGVFKAVGRKFGAWQDVAWYHRVLRSEPLTEQRP